MAVCEERAQLEEAELKQCEKRMLCDPKRQACVLRQRPGARYDLGAAFVFQPELKDGGGTDAAGGGCIQFVAHTVGGRPPGAAAAHVELGRDGAEYTLLFGERRARVLRQVEAREEK